MWQTPTEAALPNFESFAALLADPKRHVEGLLGLAATAAGDGRFGEAFRFADRARRLDPGNGVIARLAARLLTRLGRPGEALAVLERPWRDKPDGPVMLARAQVMLAAGDLAGAKAAAEDLLACFAADAFAEIPALIAATGAKAPHVAPSWRLAGRVRLSQGVLRGSATMGWAPSRSVAVILTDAAGSERRIETRARATADGGAFQAFATPLTGREIAAGVIAEAVTPDGARVQIYPNAAAGAIVGAKPRTGRGRRPKRVSVIVPVYAGLAETRACLGSVLATTDAARTELIVIDDASPDPDLKAALRDLAAEGTITLLANPLNLGFPASVNRGLAAVTDSDVVLLNADAQVYGDWLTRLRRAAYGSGDIGTVTPFANRGSMMNWPSGDEVSRPSEFGPDQGARLDATFRRINTGQTVELPSGAGFCLFIRRDCLEDVGFFDADTFGRGYGEENDFCLRAGALGWRHVGAADVYVRHVGGRSFGALAPILTAHNLRILYRRYPAYRRAIRRFLKADPIRPLRQAIDEALLVERPAPSCLIITLARPGGVNRHIGGRKAALRAGGLRPIELRPATVTDAAGACRLIVDGEAFGDLDFVLPNDFEALATLLAKAGVERAEIHHFLGLHPSALELPARLGVPYELYVHDHAWFCPRITLTGGDERYCGEPDLTACEACIAAHGGLIEEDISVAALRVRGARVLGGAARVAVPTAGVAARVRRHFPGVTVATAPWEPPQPDASPRAARRRVAGARARIAVIGAIGETKGFNVLLDCARDAAARDLPLEFVVVGHTEDDYALFSTGRVFVTGRYEEGEAQALIAREACDGALVASIWPETWCYALSEAITAGLPIVAFDIGAIGERLSGLDRATLLPLGGSAPAINAAVIGAVGSAAEPGLIVHRCGGAIERGGLESWRPDSAWIEDFTVVAGPPGLWRRAFVTDADGPWLDAGVWREAGDPRRPLMGFALRSAGHQLEYEGLFSSGAVTRAADGNDCRAPLANDPLIGLRVQIRERR